MGFLDNGTLVVCGDYKGNLNEITSALNRWRFDESYAEDPTFTTDGRRIFPPAYETIFPRTTPIREIAHHPNGRRIPSEEIGLQSRDEDPAFDYEEVGLEEISKQISPLLTYGALELAAIGHYKTTSIYFERLIVNADGAVVRHIHQTRADNPVNWIEQQTERYVPTPLLDAQLSLFPNCPPLFRTLEQPLPSALDDTRTRTSLLKLAGDDGKQGDSSVPESASS